MPSEQSDKEFYKKGVKVRHAFTMIELIFVIVILGILAAVAIPRLNATRDDAKASALAINVVNGVQEIANYATSKGMTENNLSTMSNSFMELNSAGDAVLSNKRAVVKAGNVVNCITLDINTTDDNETLVLTVGNAGSDAVCVGLQEMIHVANYPMKLRGSNVIR